MADQEETVFLYVGTYADEPTAHSDYQLVKELHKAKAVGSYDAVVVTRDNAGKIHVNKDETAFRRGGWGGAAAGAVVGVIFPPAILGAAVIATIANALFTKQYSNGVIFITTGCILLFAVTLDTLARRRQAKTGR